MIKMMATLTAPVKSEVFRAILDIDIDNLLTLDSDDLVPVLPYLVRLALNSTTKQTSQDEGFLVRRKKLMKLLHPIELANSIVPLLTIDFQKLDSDARLEQQTRNNLRQLRQTAASSNAASLSNMKSILLPKNINLGDSNELTMEFERSEGLGRLCVILAEYMNICDYLRQIKENPIQANPVGNSNVPVTTNRAHSNQNHGQIEPKATNEQFRSELFDNPIYSDDVAFCLSILLAELPPTTVNILDMSETLLYVKNGPSLIARLVANMPDMFHEVCISMINNGDKQDEDIILNELKDQRTTALRLLCEMNPIQALTIRSEAIQASRLPSLTVMITLDGFTEAISKFKNPSQNKTTHMNTKREKKEYIDNDSAKQQKQLDECYDSVIAFVSGTLLGADDKTRSWFSQYIKLAQKRIDLGHPTVLSSLRLQLLWYMQEILLPFMTGLDSEDEFDSDRLERQDKSNKSYINSQIIRACATLRMYCALRCIGVMKLNEQETSTLIRLITCKPSVSHTSVHFATIGFCTILASSSILSNQDAEKRATDWLKWLINKSEYTDTIHSTPGRSSLAELVLLVAIHFHSNQMGQIADLICETLGMKIQIKTSITKCKSLFVQDVFTDQMVTEHSVKVPVTKNLNNSIPGFLPVHCIHQLLESRAFSKHQVPIKDWIFKQICQSTAPLHSILPQLIGAYVNSIMIATSTHGPSGTNEPITYQEMEPIFKIKVYSFEDNKRDFSPTSSSPTTAPDKQSSKTAARSVSSKSSKSKLKRDLAAVNNEDDSSSSNTPKRLKLESENHNRKTSAQIVQSNVKRDNGVKTEAPEISCVLTSQILILYYLLLYEDVRLKKNPENILAGRGKLVKYKQEFMADIPIFYLLQQVHDNQHKYGCILAHLLKLVTTHYPQLCLVQHWLTSDKCSPALIGVDNLVLAKLDRMSTRKIGADHVKLATKDNNNKNLLAIKASPGQLKCFIPSRKQFSSTEELKDRLERSFADLTTDTIKYIKTINQILALPVDKLWPLSSTFVSNMSKLLVEDLNLNPLALKVSSELWWRLNLIFPRKLWVMTVNVMLSSHAQRGHQLLFSGKSKEYDWNDIVNYPLCVLRCDFKVFRTAHILDIVLHMLSAFLAASRRHLHDHLREHPSELVEEQKNREEQRNREELRVALVAAQESAALQILLEFCLPKTKQEEIVHEQLFTCINNERSSTSTKQSNNRKIEISKIENSRKHGDKSVTLSDKNESTSSERMDTDEGENNQDKQLSHYSKHETDSEALIAHKCYKESVITICNHLHQVFISDTNLARLVHFQTYSSDLLPITTTYIPSMHICLDFVPDMMAQPDLKKQVFVVELVSHLCEKYAITKSLNAAKLCFNVSYTLLQLLPNRRRAIYFIPVLPALIRMSKIFPILKEDLDIILTQLNQITVAHLASTSSRLSLGSSTTPFEGLKDMSWRDTKKLMNTMDLQEALYLTIQSCIIELNKLVISEVFD